MQQPDKGTLRAGFVMEQVLGHVTHYHTLRRQVEREGTLVPTWVEVSYVGQGRLEQCSALPASVRGTLRGYLQVREGLRRRALDALFFHTQKPAVFQWDLMRRIPTVLSLDVTPRQYDALGAFYDHVPDGPSPVAALKHWINRRTFALAELVVVWSHWVRDSLVAEYDVRAEKVRVIPPGVDRELWQPLSDSAPRVGLPRLLFVGGDFGRKGGPLLLDWFRERGRGRCELDLVTRGAVAPEPGVRVFRDVVGNSLQARELFAGADIFALPTLGECFGIASVEAMAAGLPVVTTRVGGAADIVLDGETGWLVPPGDSRALGTALDRLLADAALRRAMGQQGRARMETHFDAAANANKLLECLRDARAARQARAAAAARGSHRMAGPRPNLSTARES